VNDAADMDDIELSVFDNVIVEGYGGAIVDIDVRRNGVEILPTLIPWDRIYFDPHSRRQDFKDAQYMGMVMWADSDVVLSMFPDSADVIKSCESAGSLDDTFDDRLDWTEDDNGRKRIRLAHEFYQLDGVWMECVFIGSGYLVEPQESSYLDEDGKPTNPIELVGAHIDRDNNRFGEVVYWIDPQNEINHRRSKFLHLINSRQTFGRKGDQQDVKKIKQELAKPDGHVEFVGNKFGDDFGIIPTGDLANAQFQLLQESKASLDAVSFDAKLEGMSQQSLSGVAVNSLQTATLMEVAPLLSAMTNWKKRVFKQVWYRIKQHWNTEKWVRVTDDYGQLRWVGLNIQIPRQQEMEDFINDESNDYQSRQQAALLLQQMLQTNDPRLAEVVTTKNPVPDLDMDIIVEQSTNAITAQQEQFRLLAELAQARPGEVPFKSLLRLSELRDKDDVIKDIEAREQAALKAQAQNAELETMDKQVTIEGKQIINQKNAAMIDGEVAKTTKTNMDAISQNIQNHNLVMKPDQTPQVSV
jgi:hypothetical protein